jgi:hypothetical protein
LAGVLVGISAWIRPEGITFLGPFVLLAFLVEGNLNAKISNSGMFAGGLAIGFGPYLLFNRWLAGAWWPNTFFAKQAEFHELVVQFSLAERLFAQFGQLLIGVGSVLLPGFIWMLVRSIKKKEWIVSLSSIWLVGHLGLYALRLPVTYQHGRYQIPAILVFILWGWLGSIQALAFLWQQSRWRSWAFGGMSILVLVTIGFVGIGANAYAEDVAIINTEMVATAKWIARELPVEARLATHDIGALGYFSERPIIDLAGLISPDVIDFMNDEDKLEVYINSQDADYLVTFPGWYPQLEILGEIVFQTEGIYTIRNGEENMAVYRWQYP